MIFNICEQIPTALFLDGIAADPPSVVRIEMTVVVVDKPQFFIVVFAAPLDGLGDVPFGGDFSVRRVGIDRPQITGFPEDFRDVPGQILPVGVPGAVFADGQRARSLRLCQILEQEPSEGSADGIYGGYLQVATVHERR